jgi:O-acetyl-ADP-ribose deacetylase (regulator of RNase III)
MITIHQGSILDAQTDYIVNPANSFLQHGGGLARVIADAATDVRFPPKLTDAPVSVLWESARQRTEAIDKWKADHEVAPLIATGNAYLTSAGVLPFKGIIHAVGPIWNDGEFLEHDLLELAYSRAFEIALGVTHSIALPAISSGIFGFPIEEVARIAIAVAQWYEDAMDIQFWLFSDEPRQAFERKLGKYDFQ